MEIVVQEQDAREFGLPVSVQDALGDLVDDARAGLLALSVGVGLRVLHELMELEVDGLVGPKGKHDPGRVAVRHGHEDGAVTLGARRVAVRRPRARTVDGEREIALGSYAYFASRDPLSGVILEQLLARVSSRRFWRGSPAAGSNGRASRSGSESPIASARCLSRRSRARSCPGPVIS